MSMAANNTVDTPTDRWVDLARKPAPRYTSYPTAHSLEPGLMAEDYATWLAGIDGPFALYFHFPFCAERCTYCGCNVIASKRRAAAADYLTCLEREIQEVSEKLRLGARVTRMHWGGGTPTYYTPAQIESVMGSIKDAFTFAKNAEISVEVDPRVTTDEHLRTLRELGFNRLSIGVQDFTPAVQAMIGRVQSVETTRLVVRNARSMGFDSINVDLVYGLPLQTVKRIRETIDTVVGMRPDRVAIYGYAHLPEHFAHQRRIDSEAVPGIEERWKLERAARGRLIEAGYVEVGLDHFALPEDDLAKAVAERTLHRDFMGYTTERSATLVGLGVSSIGELPQGLVQNTKKLSSYRAALEAGHLPVVKGCRTGADDHVRAEVIRRLMCDLEVRYDEIERTRGIRFDRTFEAELGELRSPGGLIEIGVVHETPTGLVVDPAARTLVRNVCRVFDRRGREPKGSGRMSSSV